MHYLTFASTIAIALLATHVSAAESIPAKPTDNTKAAKIESSQEPNMKVTQGSGGKSVSSLVTDAPFKGDYVMGVDDAPIVIVEYASLSCPHCAHFSNNVLPELEKKYIDTGKVRYVLRQFPLNEPALKGAMLLECVGEQNTEKYFIFAKVLFDAQSKWAFDGNYMSGLETIAAVGGLSKDQFQNCVNNTDREMAVLKIKKQAVEELQVPHTPYFYIAGEVYEGDRSIEAMSAFIDQKLAQVKKP